MQIYFSLLICGFIIFIDEDEVDLGCTPLTSTPKKDSSGKHALTPNSKRQNEPSSKKLNTSESPTSVSEYSGDCGEL